MIDSIPDAAKGAMTAVTGGWRGWTEGIFPRSLSQGGEECPSVREFLCCRAEGCLLKDSERGLSVERLLDSHRHLFFFSVNMYVLFFFF